MPKSPKATIASPEARQPYPLNGNVLYQASNNNNDVDGRNDKGTSRGQAQPLPNNPVSQRKPTYEIVVLAQTKVSFSVEHPAKFSIGTENAKVIVEFEQPATVLFDNTTNVINIHIRPPGDLPRNRETSPLNVSDVDDEDDNISSDEGATQPQITEGECGIVYIDTDSYPGGCMRPVVDKHYRLCMHRADNGILGVVIVDEYGKSGGWLRESKEKDMLLSYLRRGHAVKGLVNQLSEQWGPWRGGYNNWGMAYWYLDCGAEESVCGCGYIRDEGGAGEKGKVADVDGDETD